MVTFKTGVERWVPLPSVLPSEGRVDGSNPPDQLPQIARHHQEDVADVGHDVPVEWDGLENLLALPQSLSAAAVRGLGGLGGGGLFIDPAAGQLGGHRVHDLVQVQLGVLDRIALTPGLDHGGQLVQGLLENGHLGSRVSSYSRFEKRISESERV